jgi:hypothetical protein
VALGHFDNAFVCRRWRAPAWASADYVTPFTALRVNSAGEHDRSIHQVNGAREKACIVMGASPG